MPKPKKPPYIEKTKIGNETRIYMAPMDEYTGRRPSVTALRLGNNDNVDQGTWTAKRATASEIARLRKEHGSDSVIRMARGTADKYKAGVNQARRNEPEIARMTAQGRAYELAQKMAKRKKK